MITQNLQISRIKRFTVKTQLTQFRVSYFKQHTHCCGLITPTLHHNNKKTKEREGYLFYNMIKWRHIFPRHIYYYSLIFFCLSPTAYVNHFHSLFKFSPTPIIFFTFPFLSLAIIMLKCHLLYSCNTVKRPRLWIRPKVTYLWIWNRHCCRQSRKVENIFKYICHGWKSKPS